MQSNHHSRFAFQTLFSTKTMCSRDAVTKEANPTRGVVHHHSIIFEIPAEDISEKDDSHPEIISELDQVSELSHSISEFSLESLCPSSKRHVQKSSCKRIDVDSPLHRSHFTSSLTEFSFDDDESTLSCSQYSSSFSYFTGDRWSPCHTPCENSKVPRCAERTDACQSSSYGLEEHNFPPVPTLKSDYSPRCPRRHVSVEED